MVVYGTFKGGSILENIKTQSHIMIKRKFVGSQPVVNFA